MKKQMILKSDQPRGWPSWGLTLIAVLGLLGLAKAQDNALADADARLRGLAYGVELTTAPAAGPVPAFVRTTDVGRNGGERTSTTQLIFALHSDRQRSISVEVFNESGLALHHQVLVARPGRNAMAMDVAHLREGRYVALLHEGANARVVRFRR
ncbi:MAG: hypothetical protein IT230_10040 [Flavobacteriales bacterium]|nr:hypothetical protein [Flavobacteriales bacterium]